MRFFNWHLHNWSKWLDTHKVTKVSAEHMEQYQGIRQERRCADCGKLQIRVIWAK